MIKIRKGAPSPAVQQALQQAKTDFHWETLDKHDTERVRAVFDSVDKAVLRKQMLQAQHGLCAYCMRRIADVSEHHLTIEHYIPIEQDGEKALDYNNLLLCCDGGKSVPGQHRILTCDAQKGARTLTVNPLRKDHMARIRYNQKGKIYTYPKDEDIERDLNKTLQLNGLLDANEKMLCDTSTQLVMGRKRAYEGYVQYIEGLAKRNKLTRSVLERRIKEMQSATVYEEFAGVWLYFLNRKLRGA